MRLVNRLLTLLLPLLAMLPAAQVRAVSLGDELILSRLGDPVEIEIEVLQWQDIDLDRVQISAASQAEYEVFDLTWLPVLDELRFNLVGPDLDGNVRVLVSSRDPVNEPFLELLLVLRWPGGSLRREYVLLFDPPGMPERQVPAVQVPVDASAATASAATPAPGVGTDPEPAVQEPVVQRPVVQETVVQEPVVQEPVVQEAVVQEAVVQEAVVQEPVVQEPVVQEPVRPQPAAQPAPAAVSVSPPTPEPETAVPVVTPAVAVEVPALVEPEPVVVTDTPEPVIPAVALQPEPLAPGPPPVVAEQDELPVREPAPPQPEPRVAAEEEAVIADARTQLAIDVETLSPRTPVVLDTTRRTYQVRSGDSLWNIAHQFRPAGAGENLYQMLLSMHELNRGAFINGNIALLKANAMLQIPGADDINRIDALTAQAEFERRWDEGTQRSDAAQRGEPIPLFAEDAPQEEVPVTEAESALPLGIEAPDTGEDALIMVSRTNVPQPLPIVPDARATDSDTGADTAEAESTTPVPATPEPATIVIGTETVSTRQQAEAEDEVQAQAVPASGDTVPQTVLTRAQVAAALESEVAAMRTRRATAEAIARQLNAALQKAQAEQVARDSLLGRDNVLLFGSALVLFAALVASVVFIIKIAGDLRLRQNSSGGTTLGRQGGPTWLTAETARPGPLTERIEPRMPEMEVVELHLPVEETGPAATQAQPATAAPAGTVTPESADLIARMEGLLASDEPNSGKNA